LEERDMDFPEPKRRKLDDEEDKSCSSESSDGIPDSCCSSSRCTTEEESVVEELEPSTNSSDCREIGETKEVTNNELLQPELGEVESTENPSMDSSLAKFEAEIEEFFLAEEQHLLEQFSEKYNFDFANEKPMEGRFDWVKLKP
jgi:hypothetical protein